MTDSRQEMVVERWRTLWDTVQKDVEWLQARRDSYARRPGAIQGHLELLNDFLGGEVELEGFRETFDRKNRGEWNFFGLGGVSGAMFLNKLVKHVPDQGRLTAKLQSVLQVPPDTEEARSTLKTFMDYLNGMIDQGQVRKQQIGPGYCPFFVTAWWHMQDTDTWPMYFISARNALQAEGLYESTGDRVGDYFRFCDTFLSMKEALGISQLDLESLCVWSAECGENSVPDDDVSSETETESNSSTAHTQVQWVLANMGQKLGCRVWIAANDHKKIWKGQQLGELSLESLPNLGLDVDTEKTIRLIDVLWITGTKQIAAAFEIECTTSVHSGLLRLSDLTASSPNLSFPLYIVVPKARMDKVRRELSRPTFQTLELHMCCGFFSLESLFAEADSIVKWATSPSAINKLASKLPDVGD